MAFGDIIRKSQGVNADTVTLPQPVSAGNTLVLAVEHFKPVNSTFTDNLNSGQYSVAYRAGAVVSGTNDDRNTSLHFFPNTAAGAPVLTGTTTPYRWVLMEVEGVLQDSGIGGANYDYSAAGTAVTTPSGNIPANSVTFGTAAFGISASSFAEVSPWTEEPKEVSLYVLRRADATATTDSLSGTMSATNEYAAGWASFVAVPSGPTLRKGGTQTFDKPAGIGTITGVTLNGAAITLDSQDATTFTVTDSDGSITTSGAYDLVATGDTVETIVVQVNVVGLSGNTLRKNGGILASLTDVEMIVMTGAAGSRAVNQNPSGLTSDASGGTAAVEIADVALDVSDPVFVVLHSASEGAGIPFSATLEAI